MTRRQVLAVFQLAWRYEGSRDVKVLLKRLEELGRLLAPRKQVVVVKHDKVTEFWEFSNER
jgi:hypothetical protein